MNFSDIRQKTKELEPLLCCPLCHSPFRFGKSSLICEKGHEYNITKPGTVNFITKKQNPHPPGYFRTSLAVHSLPPWQELMDELTKEAPPGSTIAFTGASLSPFLGCHHLGFESDTDSVRQQLRTLPDARLFVAEASHLPLADGCLGLLIRLDRQREMSRDPAVLSEGGHLLRVLPGPRHLLELRQRLFTGRRLGLREDAALIKSITAQSGSWRWVSRRRITLQYSPGPDELELLISSLREETDPETRSTILTSVNKVTFDFIVFDLEKGK